MHGKDRFWQSTECRFGLIRGDMGVVSLRRLLGARSVLWEKAECSSMRAQWRRIGRETSWQRRRERSNYLRRMESGTKYIDTVNRGVVVYKNKISIHITEDGFIKTVIGNAKIKSTWEIMD